MSFDQLPPEIVNIIVSELSITWLRVNKLCYSICLRIINNFDHPLEYVTHMSPYIVHCIKNHKYKQLDELSQMRGAYNERIPPRRLTNRIISALANYGNYYSYQALRDCFGSQLTVYKGKKLFNSMCKRGELKVVKSMLEDNNWRIINLIDLNSDLCCGVVDSRHHKFPNLITGCINAISSNNILVLKSIFEYLESYDKLKLCSRYKNVFLGLSTNDHISDYIKVTFEHHKSKQ